MEYSNHGDGFALLELERGCKSANESNNRRFVFLPVVFKRACSTVATYSWS